MLVLLFFGFVPVGCTYYVLCGGWTWQVAVVAAACGLVIDTLLMVNNYRDREQDAANRKLKMKSGKFCRAASYAL